MSEITTTITVEDVRKLTLPLGTRVAAGDGLLGRPATWTTVIYPDDNLDSKTLQPNEIILIAPLDKSSRSPVSDTELIRWAAEKDASAVVVIDAPSPPALAEARTSNLPVLVLPPDSRIRKVEKAIVSLLVDRRGQLERRGTQIYRQLTGISSRNEGMAGLISAMARLTGKAVLMQDKRLNITENTLQPHFIDNWEDIETFLRKQDNLPVEFQDRFRLIDVEVPVLMQSLPIPGMARLVAPVVTREVGRGYLSIIGYDGDIDDIDLLVAEHGAAACALEMAKLKAINETEKRLRGTFLDRLLLGDVSHQEALRQGERFDHDMTSVHVAIVMSWQGEDLPSTRRLETTINSLMSDDVQALTWQREKDRMLVVFHATDPENPIDSSLKLTAMFAKEMNRMFPGNPVAIGLGQPARDISAWRNSYRDAVQAMELAVRLQTDTPLYIGDLGVYQLILSLNDREKLEAFCDKTLGKLKEYDHRQNADLLKTLEAFFQCHGNLSQTAESLIVHRNTLLYRMNRINDIAEIDLNRPETRLALHLGLTIRRLLSLE
ncbi:MAG: PucR family transcriptional regulator [Aggregatilineales bacterium]